MLTIARLKSYVEAKSNQASKILSDRRLTPIVTLNSPKYSSVTTKPIEVIANSTCNRPKVTQATHIASGMTNTASAGSNIPSAPPVTTALSQPVSTVPIVSIPSTSLSSSFLFPPTAILFGNCTLNVGFA